MPCYNIKNSQDTTLYVQWESHKCVISTKNKRQELLFSDREHRYASLCKLIAPDFLGDHGECYNGEYGIKIFLIDDALFSKIYQLFFELYKEQSTTRK